MADHPPFDVLPAKRKSGPVWVARMRMPDGTRPGFTICPVKGTSNARARATFESWLEKGLLEKVAAVKAKRTKPTGNGGTFLDIGRAWTSGELARDYPDHVDAKKSANDDRWRLTKHVYPHVQDIPISDFTREDAERVMKAIPSESSRATRRHVAQLMSRILALAVEPLRIIKASPLPRGFLPKASASKALSSLWPDEDARVMKESSIPLCYRILYGFLDREGPRASEAADLQWRDLDLVRGVVTLDENKTDDPRAWALDPGVVRALAAWKKTRGEVAASDPVFIQQNGARVNVDRGAERFRAHLEVAGVTRPELFETSSARRPIRLHDLRATFITVSLSNGKSEAWVMDRTGHTTSLMLNRYRRVARKAEQVSAGALEPLDEALGMDTPYGHVSSSKGGGQAHQGERAMIPGVHERGVEPLCLAAPEPKSCREDGSSGEASSPSTVDGAGVDANHPNPGGASMTMSIETPLAVALTEATRAGRWDVVAQLAAELQARRLDRSNVVSIAKRGAR